MYLAQISQTGDTITDGIFERIPKLSLTIIGSFW